MEHHPGSSSPCSIVEEDDSKFCTDTVSGQTWELVICDVVKAHCYVVDNGWIDLEHTHSRVDNNWLPSVCYWLCYVSAIHPLPCHLCLPCQSIHTVMGKGCVCAMNVALKLHHISFHMYTFWYIPSFHNDGPSEEKWNCAPEMYCSILNVFI